MTSELPRVSPDAPVWKLFLERVATVDVPSELLEAAVQSVRWPTTVPSGHFDSEVLPAVMRGLLTSIAAMEDGHRVPVTEVAEWVVPVVERHAEDGIPLPTLVRALHGAWAHLWAIICETASDQDGPAIATIGAHMTDILATMSVVMTETYQDTDSELRANRDDARRMLTSALLAGGPAEDLATAAGVVLTDSYYVLAVEADSAAEPHGLIPRRRARYARTVLLEFGSTDILTTFDGNAGVVLMPTQFVNTDSSGEARTIESLIDSLADRLSVDLYASVRPATLSTVPDAVAEANELVRLARQLNRPPRLYRLDDLLFEYQATRPGPAHATLAELIAPLRQHPGLLRALHLQLKYGPDRKAAAAELFVHPNTFTYRLRRIRELTGADPTDPEGSRLFAAALIVHTVENGVDPDARIAGRQLN